MEKRSSVVNQSLKLSRSDLCQFLLKSVKVRDQDNFKHYKDEIEKLTLKLLGINNINEFKPQRTVRGVVPVAGIATRMGGVNKALCEVAGQPIIEFVLDILTRFDRKPIVVVRPENWRDALGISKKGGSDKEFKKVLEQDGYRVEYCYQDYLKGDGLAVLATKDKLKNFDGDLIIIWGDMAVLREETVLWLVAIHQALGGISLSIASLLHERPYAPLFPNEKGYVIGGKKGATVEFGLEDIGAFVGRAQDVFPALQFLSLGSKTVEEILQDCLGQAIIPAITEREIIKFYEQELKIPQDEFTRIKEKNPDWDPLKVEVYCNPYDGSVNKKGELNFVQIVSPLSNEGLSSIAVPLADEREWKGVDTIEELKQAPQLRQELGIKTEKKKY